MTTTPKLGMALLAANQSQKYITMNEALLELDALVQLTVINQTTNTPPGSPVDGDSYIIGSSPTGVWSGHAKSIAVWNTSGWDIHTSGTGWTAYDVNTSTYYAFDGTNWNAFSGSLTGASIWGVNATADSTNKLSVASSSVLFDQIGSDMRLTMNKHATGDTASTLYQTNYVGHAEVGLCGDNNFHFKVSSDGSTWFDALSITNSSGLITPHYGIGGTATNDDAPTGGIGESIVGSAAAVSISANTSTNIASISLTAGDWDVWGNVLFIPAGSTVPVYAISGINSTSATLPANTDPSYNIVVSNATGTEFSSNCMPIRIKLSTTTTIHLVCNANFTISTMTVNGNILARRRR